MQWIYEKESPATTKAVVTTTIRPSFDCNSIALRPFDNYVMSGLLCCNPGK